MNQFSGKFYSCNFLIDERFYYNNYATANTISPVIKLSDSRALAFGNYTSRSILSQQVLLPTAAAPINVPMVTSSGITKISMLEYFQGLEITDSTQCKTLGGRWTSYPYNFDNVFNAVVTLFKLSTTEGWIETMSAAIDTTEIKLSPRRNNSPFSSIYFVLFFVVGSFFTYNLFSVLQFFSFICFVFFKILTFFEKKKIVQIQNYVAFTRLNKKFDMQKRNLTWKEKIFAILFKQDPPRQKLMKEFKKKLKESKDKIIAEEPVSSPADEKKNLLSDKNIFKDTDGTLWRNLKKLLKQHAYEQEEYAELETGTRKTLKEFFTISPDQFPRAILDSGLFDAFFTMIIISNLLLLVVEYYHAPDYLSNLLFGANVIFSFFYAFELTFRLIYFDPRIDSYFLIIVDGIVVVSSFVENVHFFIYEFIHYLSLIIDTLLGLVMSSDAKVSYSPLIALFAATINFEFFAIFYHSIRTLRTLRIVQSNSIIAILYTTAKGSLINLLELFGVYSIIMLIYTTTATAMFGRLSPSVFSRFQFPITKNFYIFHLDVALEVVKQIPELLQLLERPRTMMVSREHASFGSVWNSFLTLFRLTKGDQFNELFRLILTGNQVCSRKLGDCPPNSLFLVFFFLSFIFCFVIISNLIIAILLHHFSEFLDAWDSFSHSKSEWARYMYFTGKQKVMLVLSEFFISMKQQKAMLCHIQERSDQLLEKNAALIESFNGLMMELDEKWKKFCIETNEKIPFSIEMSTDAFESFLKEVNPFFNIIKDTRITPMANFKQLFGEKFKISEDGTVNYENVMLLLFEDKFNLQNKAQHAPTYVQLK